MLFLFWPAPIVSSSGFFPNLFGMDYGYFGQPFIEGPDPTSTDLNGMDYGYFGQPFVRYSY